MNIPRVQRLPLVLRSALCNLEATQQTVANLTGEDPLPAVIDVDASGIQLSYRTKYTAVHRETSDER